MKEQVQMIKGLGCAKQLVEELKVYGERQQVTEL